MKQILMYKRVHSGLFHEFLLVLRQIWRLVPGKCVKLFIKCIFRDEKLQRIAEDVKLGKNVKIYDFVNLYGCEIGDNTRIACFVEIQKGAKIGRNCKVSSHAFICEGVTIEDNVFVGHHVIFINDKYPRATNKNGELGTEADWVVQPTLVKRGATLGSGAVILCNVTIGENAIVGAGSVVTRDVPPNATVAGNPARVISARSGDRSH